MPWGRDFGIPDFLALVLVFWNVHQPRKVGIGIGFLLGLLMDVHNSSALGERALLYSLLVLRRLVMHRRVPWFSHRRPDAARAAAVRIAQLHRGPGAGRNRRADARLAACSCSGSARCCCGRSPTCCCSRRSGARPSATRTGRCERRARRRSWRSATPSWTCAACGSGSGVAMALAVLCFGLLAAASTTCRSCASTTSIPGRGQPDHADPGAAATRPDHRPQRHRAGRERVLRTPSRSRLRRVGDLDAADRRLASVVDISPRTDRGASGA